MARSTFWFDRDSLSGLARQLKGSTSAPPSTYGTSPPRAPVIARAPVVVPEARATPRTARVVDELSRVRFEAIARWLASPAARTGDLRLLTIELFTEALELLELSSVSLWRADTSRTRLTGLFSRKRASARHAIPTDIELDRESPLGDLLTRETTEMLVRVGEHPMGAYLVAAVDVDASTAIVVTRRSDEGTQLLLVERPLLRRWTDDERHVVEAIANVLALATSVHEHATQAEIRRAQETRARSQHATLMRLARSPNMGLVDPMPMFREITEAATQVLGIERTSIWFYYGGQSGQTSQRGIVCRDLYIAGPGRHENGVELEATAFPAYFDALRTERSIAAHDAHTDVRTREFSEPYLRPLGIFAMLDAPIRAGGRMVGVLCHEHVGQPRFWTVEEEQFAGALADLVALALEASERRRAEEDRRERDVQLRKYSDALLALTRSDRISRGDLDLAVQEITAAATEHLQLGRSSVWLYNPDRTAIHCADLFRTDSNQHESGLELGSDQFPGYFRALREERVISAVDARTDGRTREFTESYLTPLGIHAMLDAPIRVGNRMVGVLCNEHLGAPRVWKIEEEQFASSLADLVALAMESAERKQAEEELRQTLALMSARA